MTSGTSGFSFPKMVSFWPQSPASTPPASASGCFSTTVVGFTSGQSLDCSKTILWCFPTHQSTPGLSHTHCQWGRPQSTDSHRTERRRMTALSLCSCPQTACMFTSPPLGSWTSWHHLPQGGSSEFQGTKAWQVLTLNGLPKDVGSYYFYLKFS